MEIKDCFYIGYISKTRGLRGELQLFFEYEDYKELEFDTIFIEIDKKLVPFFIEELKVQNNSTAYIFLEDVDHIDKAQPLIRHQIYLPNNNKPQRKSDDFRISDLKGFGVHDSVYGFLGQIQEVHNFPQQHVASVMYKSKEILFPLNKDIIEHINKETDTIKVNLPEGLIDLYLNS